MRVVRRYSNRKLYDTVEKRYVTLQHVEKLIRLGEDVRIEDEVSGRDITNQCLGQLLAAKARGNGALDCKSLLNGKHTNGTVSRREFDKLAAEVRRLREEIARLRKGR